MPPTITSSLVREAEPMKALFREGIPVPQVLEYDPTHQKPCWASLYDYGKIGGSESQGIYDPKSLIDYRFDCRMSALNSFENIWIMFHPSVVDFSGSSIVFYG